MVAKFALMLDSMVVIISHNNSVAWMYLSTSAEQ